MDETVAESLDETPAETPTGRGLVTVVAALVLAGVYGGLLLAYGLPTDWSAPDTLAQRLAWNGTLLRQVLPQAGVGVVLVGAWGLWRRQRWVALSLLPALAVCWGPCVWQLRPRGEVAVRGAAIQVVSANLLNVNRTPDLLVRELLAIDADVLLLQELSASWVSRLNEALIAYPHRVVRPRGDAFGVAVYSKRPLLSVEQVTLSDWDMPQVRCVVELGGRGVALYTVHFAPPRVWAYARIQRGQMRRLLARLDAEPGAVILAGDFNATERSPFADAFDARGFVDALDARGWGRETTWPVLESMEHLPSMRLDHVYLKGLSTVSARTGTGAGSDHRPVIVEAVLPSE